MEVLGRTTSFKAPLRNCWVPYGSGRDDGPVRPSHVLGRLLVLKPTSMESLCTTRPFERPRKGVEA